MKSLLVIAVIVFCSVGDLLFYGGHNVHAVLGWIQSTADSIAASFR
jgi:hypothetical protein